MEQRQYHCFIAGLPEPRFDGSALSTTPAKFVKKMRRELHPDDNRMADLLLLRYDHDNLVRFLNGEKLINKGIALFTEEEFNRQLDNFGAIVPGEDILPPYMSEILLHYTRPGNVFDPGECRRKLDDGYFRFIMTRGSPFIKGYTNFEYNLANLLTYVINRKAGEAQPDEGIAGDSDFARHLHETAGKNLVKDPEFEYFDEILAIREKFSMAEAEIRYDRLRWDVIEKLTLFDFFTADTVLAYLQKLLIASRWEGLTPQAGKEELQKFIYDAIVIQSEFIQKSHLP